MCGQCGCAVTPEVVRLSNDARTITANSVKPRSVEILTGILSENDHEAAHNREHLDGHRVLAVNLMSSPGSGKTSLLEATIDAIGDRFRIAVIEGDLETENDAKRIRAKGVPAVQITTGNTCHLDAHMVHDALHALDLDTTDILFIENVGNLVCPASFDLGQHANVDASRRHRRRRQAGKISGDVPQSRSGFAVEDRSARCPRRFLTRPSGEPRARAGEPGTGAARFGAATRYARALDRVA